MTFGLVDVGYSLPKGQAVKLIFFAPCIKYSNRFRSVKHLNHVMSWNARDILTALFTVLLYSDETTW